MKKQTWIRAAIICVIAAAVLIAGIILLKSNDDSQYSEKRGNMTEGFGQLKTVEIGGVKYREKPAVTTLLICGIDVPAETDDISEATYRNAGPADFLLLLGIDHTDKKIHQLQIDRDCMTEITTIGILGKRSGSRVTQLCLAHGFGDGFEISCELTAEAVSKLLLHCAFYFINVRIDAVKVAVICKKLGCCFYTNTVNTRNVVRSITV